MKKKHGWNDGDEVISASLTFVSTNHAIRYAKLEPVFADVDQYLCLDPQSILQKITPKTRAVVFVGLGGNSGQLEEVSKICKERGLALVLDAAHMAGTRVNQKHVGHNADVSFSELRTQDVSLLLLSLGSEHEVNLYTQPIHFLSRLF
ncbi:aminotransferase class I/II-fold pyridoxal phosphate-dependent enzyme [Vibrio panuliri]|uniref:aminotransferase class I/II-fold pyridoxal phosphate-dependent enzyme n=1 Tax=Vibrio panuliri TaxID=1381081 RepID=UPI00339A552B